MKVEFYQYYELDTVAKPKALEIMREQVLEDMLETACHTANRFVTTFGLEAKKVSVADGKLVVARLPEVEGEMFVHKVAESLFLKGAEFYNDNDLYKDCVKNYLLNYSEGDTLAELIRYTIDTVNRYLKSKCVQYPEQDCLAYFDEDEPPVFTKNGEYIGYMSGLEFYMAIPTEVKRLAYERMGWK